MIKVTDIMTREIVTIRNSAIVSNAIKLMEQRNVQALIVQPVDSSDAYGIVSASDVVGQVIAFGRDPNRIRVYEIMTKPCVVLNPNLRIEYAARLLTQANLHSAPVIQSELLGILSITDILKHSHPTGIPQVLELANDIQALSEKARQICEDNGPGSEVCAEAWAAVDVLQAELAHQQLEPLDRTASEQFWQDYSEDLGEREYDEWCGG